MGLLSLVVGVVACEKTTHENLDKWMRTQKGPGKLKNALKDGDLDPDLRAHAARNLIRKDDVRDVEETYQILTEMADEARQPVLAKLVERLSKDAYLATEMAIPTGQQSGAKDALFRLRSLADDANREAIDDALVQWLTDGYYSGRARSGRIDGVTIVRAIGPAAAPELIQRAKSIIVAPKDDQGARLRLEEPLLMALAASGHPEAVGLVIELITADRGDPKLPQLALDALYQAFVDNGGQEYALVPGAALRSHLEALVTIAKDDSQPNKIVNDVIALIGAAGPPACIAPLVELIAYPHAAKNYMWVAANAALRCGEANAVVAVADALPKTAKFERAKLAGAIWEPLVEIGDPALVAEQARTLLGSQSWVSRIIGVELLGELGTAQTAAADAERIRGLSGDKTQLAGWWGDQDQLPKSERKPVPRLGERAQQVAKQLDLVAKDGPK